MKTKKKASNAYKFQSFVQRISNINIDVLTQTGDKFHGIPENEKDTFFRESLVQLSETNCSLDFISLYKELKPFSGSFNLVVYHKDHIVATLKEYLSLDGSFALKPCLQLVSSLARDLSQDFFPIFEELFGVLIKLLKQKDAELHEDTFVCLAYVFKCTWRYLLKEIGNIFRNFKCLLVEDQIHIRLFAAELFAFLIQKSKEKEEVIRNLFQEISEEPRLAVGVGCVIFQTIKGIKYQFILSAKEIVGICLVLFRSPDINKDQICTALETTWIYSLKHAQPEYSEFLFTSLYEVIAVPADDDGNRCLSYYFKLLDVAVSQKRGYYVTCQLKLFETLNTQFSSPSLTSEDIPALLILLKTSIEISNLKVPDTVLVDALGNIFSCEKITVKEKLDFCRLLFRWSRFDEVLKQLILDFISKYLLQETYKNELIQEKETSESELMQEKETSERELTQEKDDILIFITDLIYKDEKFDKPFSLYSSPLQFSVSSSELMHIQSIIIQQMDTGLWESDVKLLWTIVTCLGHIEFNDRQKLITSFSPIINHGLQLCQETEGNDKIYTLAHCIKSFLLIEKDRSCVFEVIPWDGIVSLIHKNPTNSHVLQVFEAYCCFLGDGLKLYSKECIENLHQILKVNINSPRKFPCLLTLMIFKHFDDHCSEVADNGDVFQHCINAMNIDVSINTYQERLIIMRLLVWHNGMSPVYGDAALRFLIGNLFLNFSLMWEPVGDIIATYAVDENQYFWDIWYEILNLAADKCAVSHILTDVPSDHFVPYSKSLQYENAPKSEGRFDYRNFRVLLWKTMCKFSALAEKKAEDVVQLYLKFMQDEYCLIDEMTAQKQDLSTKPASEMITSDRKTVKKGKSEFQALCAHLKVFSMFKKPKKIEEKFHLYKTYLDFLTSKDPEIQSLAISCLMTYAHPYMTPYKENFDNLMIDSKFRDELMNFTVVGDDEEGAIKQEHRKLLMPVLIRLLYGKLQRRAGLGTGGKTSSSARQNIIMQFLINCSDDEVEAFFEIILEPFSELKNVSLTNLVVNITAIVPLRKQTGFLKMFAKLIQKISSKVERYLSPMFEALLKVLWICSQVLESKDEVHVSYISRVKDIRRQGLVLLNELFEKELNISFHDDKTTEIFTAAVWPQLPNFVADSVQCATPLLKIFLTWSKNVKYHHLLAVKDGEGRSPISSIFQLLQKTSLSSVVEGLVMMICLNLLTVDDKVVRKDAESIKVDDESIKVDDESIGVDDENIKVDDESIKVDDESIKVDDESIEVDDESIEVDDESIKMGGIEMLQPYITNVLNYISDKIVAKMNKTTATKKKQMMKNVIPNIQFSVLSHLSKQVLGTEQSSLIVSILFPLLQCIGSEVTQVHIISTINNLLPYVTDCTSYLDIVPSIFSAIEARTPRQILCEVYLKMTKDHDDLKVIGDTVNCLNAWDAVHLNEPDYEKRLGAFRKINEHVKGGQWNATQLLPILHNTLHVMLTTEDLSLRNAASGCIEAVISSIELNNLELFSVIILKTLFPIVKSGLKSKKDYVCIEFIALLGLLVKTFNHNQFADMSCLCADDPEMDFFKNFNHIQVHRKTRAVRQLSLCCEKGTISVSNMFFIFMPMITPLLFTKLGGNKDHNLLTETISAVGCIMKHLPWCKYVHVLKNYLKVLQKDIRNQKNTIRLLMAVLDNFHFDLSSWEGKSEEVEETKLKEDEDNDDDEGEADIDVPPETDSADTSDNTCESKILVYNSSKKIYTALTNVIIPQLNRFLKKKGAYDSSKSNYKEVDDQEMLKLPMELALAKLLQKLPTTVLHSNLPGVLLRVSQSLKSHSKEVRESGRDILKKITLSLGAPYTPMVLKEMRSLLHQGYQRHVLGFTLHSILENMIDVLKSGDLDGIVHDAMEIVVDELLGTVAEEKEVAAISSKLYEAQHCKSNATSEIIARYVSNEFIGKIITPVKEILHSTQNHTSIHKIEEVLFHVANGLQANSGLIDSDMLIFIHGVVSNAMADKKEETDTNDAEGRKDSYLVPDRPARGGVKPQTSDKTNNHVLVTFGLHLLNSCLKRQRFKESDSNHVQMLDPIIPLILTNILSPHNKIVALSLKCLCFLFKFQLPSMKSSYNKLGKNVFKIMKTFTQAGASKGKDVELIASSFKVMTILVRDHKDFSVTDKQFKILLSLVEEDIHTSSRQVVALPLLKSILSRKVKINLVTDIILKICDLSIRDSDLAVQLHCRKIVLQYLLDYPLGKKIINHFDFYITHLSYEEETGRISSLEMLTLIINNIPEKLLIEYAGYMFIPLVMMLVNDDSAVCRKLCGCTVKTLIQKLNINTRDEMFTMIAKFFTNSNTSLRHVSVQLTGLFAEVEGKGFSRRIDTIIPIFKTTLQKCVTIDDDADEDKSMEKSLYITLNCLVKIFGNFELVGGKEEYINHLGELCTLSKVHLLHPHAWIRLAASQLISLYFGSFTPEEWLDRSKKCDKEVERLESNIKELCFLFLAQLKDNNLTKEIGNQTTKNLIFLFRVIKLQDPLAGEQMKKTSPEGRETIETSQLCTEDREEIVDSVADSKNVSVKSLIRKFSKLAAFEAANTPKETKKRLCVLRLIASVSLCLGETHLSDYLLDLLPAVHREIVSPAGTESPLYSLAQEVLDLIKGVVKKDIFAEVYAKLQKNNMDRKESKKRKLLTEAITNPSFLALRKQKRNLVKRDQRKRKLCEKKPGSQFKKRRITADT